MDLTYIVVFAVLLIAAVVTGLATFAWSKWVRPWIETHSLQEEACIVVDAVEALLGRFCGPEKWKLALQKMQERGWNIDADKVVDALKAAWTNLNLAQIASGVKALPEDNNAEMIE